MTNNNTNEQQLIKENEILSKLFLEMLLKHSDKMAKRNVEQRKTDEEIKEILGQPDWRKKTEFRIVSDEEGDWVGHWWSIPWLISVREPLTIIENLNKEKELKKALYNQSLRIVARQSKKNEEQEIKNKELEEKVKELTVFKEQVEDLETKLTETLLTYQKEEENKENNWDYWNIAELKNLTSKVKGRLNEVIFIVIKKFEQDAKLHSEAIDVAKEWKDWQVEILKEEIKENLGLLKKEREGNKRLIIEKKNLQNELEQQKELLRKAQEIIKNQRVEKEELNNKIEEKELKFNGLKKLYRTVKSLPKKPNKVKLIKDKMKNKVQNLIGRKKSQEQKVEVFAQIETRTNWSLWKKN